MLSAQIIELMEQVDNDFSPPLSKNINFELFAEKIINNSVIFQMCDKGILAGFVALYCNDFVNKTAFIPMIAIHTEYRRKGLALNLVNMAIQYAKDAGFEKISLEVYKSNQSAKKLYNKLGFSVIAENENSYVMSINL